MRRIYTHGKIYTFDAARPYVEAAVVEHGRFIDRGSSVAMLQHWKNAVSEIVNLERKTVTPGLTDSHLHLSGIAESFLGLDLTGITAKYSMLEKISSAANELQPGEWLLGRGWDENLFSDSGIPMIEELDHVAPNVPLFLTRVCSHAFLVNSKALEYCDVHASFTFVLTS